MITAVGIVIKEDLVALTVYRSLARYSYVLFMAGKQETAAVPACAGVVVLEQLCKVENIFLVQTAYKHCSLFKVKIDIALEDKRSA